MLKPRSVLPRALFVLGLAAAGLQATAHAQVSVPATYSQFIIFGDSLSDTGNDADVSDAKYSIRFPGPEAAEALGSQYSYTDGRCTDGTDSSAAATLYSGVWHEQLAKLFFGMTPAKASMDGGLDFAFGGATTESGQNTLTEGDGTVSINVDNMGRQVSNYLAANTPDPAALYIVWGGANDIFDNADGTNVTNAAAREATLVQTLGEAGAKFILVPNLPPLGYTPAYNTSAATSAAYNQVSSDFRDQLNTDLDNINTVLEGENIFPTIFRLDVYTLFMNLHANPAAYGFVDITNPSQGSDANPDTSIFWDGVHPTTAGHFQLAAEAYSVLTGMPVVELNSAPDKSGIFFTRTGTNVPKLVTYFTAVGTAVEGVDYAELSGKVKFKPGQTTKEVTVTPLTTDSGKKIKLKLLPETDYVRPVVVKAVIKLP